MPIANRTNLADLRGAARLAFDATEGVAGIVETMHRTIQLRPGALGRPASDRPGGIAGLVYRGVRGGIRLVSRGIDTGLGPAAKLLPEGESSLARDAFRSALNGVYGDHLHRTGNPLAIDGSLRYRGRPVDLRNPTRAFVDDGVSMPVEKLLVLVHGLCMNDRQWRREQHDHGEALARDLGYVPVYLRYNSGLHVASNGTALAEMLETLIGNRALPVQELAIIGHSMGGLVARSACHHAEEAHYEWPKRLKKLVFLGTPHHGAPLERAGHGLDRLLGLSPYAAPLARIGRARSAGITDLRHGATSAEDRQVPLPSGVKCYAAAAVRAARRSLLSERLVGDGLVPLTSALGQHRDPERSLAIPKSRQWIGYGMGHLELLNRADVYARIRGWLQ